MLEEKRNLNIRNDGAIVSLDELVPKFHLLRKIDRSIDWKKIYPIVEGKYSKIGRPSVDPVVLVKMVLLQHIYGIRSLRQTVAEIEVPTIRLHDLRHSVASNLLNMGFTVVQVAEWLGHSSSTTTLNYYAHTDKTSKISISNSINDIFSA